MLYEIQFNKLHGWQVWRKAANGSCEYIKSFKTREGAVKYAEKHGERAKIWG